MSALTREEIVRGLMDKGAPREAAERCADDVIRRRNPQPMARFVSGYQAASGHPAEYEVVPPVAPPIAWPLRLVLPWSLLVSDNERKEPYVAYSSDGPVARMRLTKRYATAKEKIEQLARFKLAGTEPAEQLLELTALVWVPGGRVGNDVANFGKGVHDALEKIVYRNDNQLRATHWLHAGVDVDSPRCELTISPL